MTWSLKTRMRVILVVSTVIVQVVSFASVISIRARETRTVMVGLMAADMAFVQNFLREQPPAERERWLSQLDRGYYRLALQPASRANPAFDESLLRQTAQSLAGRLDPGETVRTVQVYVDENQWLPAIEVELGSTEKLAIMFEREPPFAPPAASVILLYFLALCLPIVAVIWFAVRQATAPLARLAEAAQQLGRNLQSPPVPEEGATEVVEAARAMNRMQAALQKHFDERTHILAAVSHDLKTPLTRLRLRTESQVMPEHRERFAADIEAMSAMVQDGLDYAQSERPTEALRSVDLNRLAEGLVEDARDMGSDVSLSGRAEHPVRAAPRALQRVLQNLIDNAVRYGGSASLSLHCGTDGPARVYVDDRGPGLPPDMLEAVFDPFFRLEQSRNRETGGTGLGLTIARNLAAAQGGQVHLENRPEGGLRAVLSLPLA